MDRIKQLLLQIKHLVLGLKPLIKNWRFIKLLKAASLVGAISGSLLLFYVLSVIYDTPRIEEFAKTTFQREVVILDANGDTIAMYGDILSKPIQYSQIPRYMIQGLLATEDRKFFEHTGVDVWGIVRAMFVNLKAGRTVQGGSTITQQLAKISFLTPQRTLKRKIQEAFLAINLEMKYTKQEIMEMYLERVYLGSGLYGIDSAAKYYLGKNVADLNLYESALIVGLIKAPSRYSPTYNPVLSGNRAYQILLNMYEVGFITKQQLEDTPLLKLNTELMGSGKKNYFTDWVYETAMARVADQDSTSNLVVKTTFNHKLNKVAQGMLHDYITSIEELRRVTQGAVVILDRHGKILAMAGGIDYKKSSFNRVTQSRRPAGSAFKMIVYTTAMEEGYEINQLMKDQKIVYEKRTGIRILQDESEMENYSEDDKTVRIQKSGRYAKEVWAPKNFYKDKYLGEVTLETAFAHSINTVAIQLADEVGVGNVIKTARKMGITSQLDQNLSLALGTASLSLLELATAYNTIADGGYLAPAYGIEYIKSVPNNIVLYKHDYIPERTLGEETVAKMNKLLEGPIAFGTAKNAKSSVVDIRGKTGTSQEFRDAWFIGYTDDYTIGVWMGNDDYSPTNKVSGGTFPPILAKQILEKIYYRP